jgi:hypothetical protein
MSGTSDSEVIGELPLPKSIAELREQGNALKRCSACRQRQATHTISLTLAKLGVGRGATEFTLHRVAVCEACGSQVAGLARRALKA